MNWRTPNKWVAVSLVVTILMASCRSASFTGQSGAFDLRSIRCLARDVDRLERLIERHGSVVVKQPDVWGQARLTLYRNEYEQQMAAELPNFAVTLQGSVAGSDQAYLADAAALSAAASGSQATVQRPARGGSSTSTTTNAISILPGNLVTPSTFTQTQTTPAAGGASPTVISPLVLPDPNGIGTFGAFNNVSRTGVNMPQPLTFAGAKNGISLEPTQILDQKSQYLNHLHELRRISEGDDTADSPGYALNLVRFPVSVLPGQKTDMGYGAEVTMTMRPYLSDELLPTTFRNLVLNDLVDQIAFPVTQFINDPQNEVYLDPHAAEDVRQLFRLLDTLDAYSGNSDRGRLVLAQLFVTQLRDMRLKPSLEQLFARPEWEWVDRCLTQWQENETSEGNEEHEIVPSPASHDGDLTGKQSEKMLTTRETERLTHADQVLASVKLDGIDRNRATLTVVSQSKSRRAQMPFPPNQMTSIYGLESFYLLAKEAYDNLSKERFTRPAVDQVQVYIHLPDVQGYLREKLAAAYELLKQDFHLPQWDLVCLPQNGLSAAIRNDDQAEVYRQRVAYYRSFPTDGSWIPKTLSWAILVESALLNEKLKEDVKESANLKNGVDMDPSCTNFYGPDPSPEARQMFNQYVQVRWPIHVFALDPTAQEQNLQSTFSSRREMQLALSLAFVNGRVSASNMLQYARRLEFDYATIDLNGTAIGFSHGEETFGWRFYPRFQTPDIECNGKVVFRDLLLGGPNKNDLLKQRRMEPGIRECYAVVIMPSFVPYASLNVSTSWFDLTNPRNKQLDSTDAMNLSERVKALETSSQCVVDGACYRDGDLIRLMEKAHQLEARLPLQDTQVQIPYENTLGGFAMFNAGVTELAPELDGWYGTASINPGAPTTLFLVGDHFSVHQTSVIAGGQPITNQQMLSRQVLQITIPQNPLLVGDAGAQFVDVQLATPYGVTQHLLIPAVAPPKPADPNSISPQGIAWNPAVLTLGFTYGATGIVPAPAGTSTPPAPVYKPTTILIQPGDVDPAKYNTVDITLKFDKKYALDKGSPIKVSATYDASRQGYNVPLPQLTQEIYSAFDSYFGPEDTSPPFALSSTTILVFRSAADASLPPIINKTTTNNLAIQWIKSPAASTAKPGQ